eukprot:Skav216960  [mRNA]  locus=scaffold2531:120813:121857:+ [translate_table: standard]
MVRVQNDMLSAQYTTKDPGDGSRREVNLIPNAQIEDQLFNQLADKKVDVEPSTSLAAPVPAPVDPRGDAKRQRRWVALGLPGAVRGAHRVAHRGAAAAVRRPALWRPGGEGLGLGDGGEQRWG